MKQFSLTIESQQSKITRNLTFRLNDNPVTHKWIKLITDNKVADCASRYDWVAAGYSVEHLTAVWEDMSTVVKMLNAKKLASINEMFLKEMTQTNLNELHQIFHVEHEKVSVGSEGDPYLSKLNYDVHIAELCMSNIKRKTRLGYLVTRFNQFEYIDLVASDYQYFNNYGIYPGDLNISFGTLGKNLFHCAMDNDISVIENGLVRPKITLNSEIQIVVGQVENKAGQSERIKNMYYAWCNNNQVLEKYGYDCQLPLHTGGNCTIGTANFDPAELNDWLIANRDIKFVSWQFD